MRRALMFACTGPDQQSRMFVTEIKGHGKATRYIKYRPGPQEFREPRHLRTHDIEEIKWIQKYVLGIDWTHWEGRLRTKTMTKRASRGAASGFG